MSGPVPGGGPGRPRVGSRSILVVGVVVAVFTAGLWLFLARDDGRHPYVRAASDQAVPIGATTWSLNQLRVLDSVPVYSDEQEPVRGARFVVAELDADLTGLADGGLCVFTLVAGDYRFNTESGYSPTGAATVCTPGTDGPISVAFEVPQRLVDQVEGVAVSLVDGSPETLLPGSPQ